jgi:16S rRNA processing protein RimM
MGNKISTTKHFSQRIPRVLPTGQLFDNKRKKVNKYASFSSAPDDPLLLTIARVKEDEISSEIEKNTHVRGTTTPLASRPSLTKRRNIFLHAGKHPTHVIPSDPSTFGYSPIGTIIGPHGVKGEIKVKIESDFAHERMKQGSLLYIKKPNRRTPRPVEIVSGRPLNDQVFLIKIKGIVSRLAAESFTSFDVFVLSSDRPVLKSNEYLVRDLTGLKCLLETEQGVEIGEVVIF